MRNSRPNDPKWRIDIGLHCGVECFGTKLKNIFTLLLTTCVRNDDIQTAQFNDRFSNKFFAVLFLSQIPWGKMFRRIPLIAGAHHERLNGTGYPNRLRAEEIPVQSKMMAIADIYDALTAARPYKRPFTSAEALDIMWTETRKGWRDPAWLAGVGRFPAVRTTGSPIMFSGRALWA